MYQEQLKTIHSASQTTHDIDLTTRANREHAELGCAQAITVIIARLRAWTSVRHCQTQCLSIVVFVDRARLPDALFDQAPHGLPSMRASVCETHGQIHQLHALHA